MPRNSRLTYSLSGGSREFKARITELLQKARRLAEMEAKGYQYRPVRVKATHVKAHRRRAYTVMRPVKRK